VDRLLRPDTAVQAAAAGKPDPGPGYHTWYPVLQIGSDKAKLYLEALIEDIVLKKSHLTDPLWLLKVGLYLEFLTFMGIVEAVREEVGDLLSPAERRAYDQSPSFTQIRERVDVPAWREVWGLRHISFPRFGTPDAGPVSMLNLLQKRKATIAFMEVHHNDLKHAIALAGVNRRNAQETWHRVVRDAERAVLRQTETAFPELAHLNSRLNDFLLWHQKGKLGALGMNWLPAQITSLFGDQDGLYAMACNKYRESMNEVAHWAKEAGYLDYTGGQCVPAQASLLQAEMDGWQEQVDRLQRRDGKSERLLDASQIPEVYRPSAVEIEELLRNVSIFQLLTDEEVYSLARNVRPIHLGPMERIIVQGRQGSSLFVVAEGQLEVLVRQPDGVDLQVAIVHAGAVVGEVSLLTGEVRSASVRAVDSAMVYEIGNMQYEPILRARPSLIEELACLMEERLRANRAQSAEYDSRQEVKAISERIRRFFFANR
jgi:CRP-like cAMP-binding protein